MELTHEEESVFSGISFNAEQIKNGVLDDNDMALLKEMRAVAAYLNAKYPAYKFEITGCELKNGTVKTYNEWYFKAEGIERDSAFIALFEAVDGTIKIRDDFYGEIVRKEIQDTLVGILTESGLPVIRADIGFWEYLGEEFGEGILAKDLLQGKIPAGNDIKIFLDGSRLPDAVYSATAGKIAQILKKEKVTGDIYIVVLKGADSDFAKDRLYSKSMTLD